MKEYRIRIWVNDLVAIFSLPFFVYLSYQMFFVYKADDAMIFLLITMVVAFSSLRFFGIYTISEEYVERRVLFFRYSFKFSDLKEVIVANNRPGNNTVVFKSDNSRFVLPSIPYIQGELKGNVESLIKDVVSRSGANVNYSSWADFYLDKNCK